MLASRAKKKFKSNSLVGGIVNLVADANFRISYI